MNFDHIEMLRSSVGHLRATGQLEGAYSDLDDDDEIVRVTAKCLLPPRAGQKVVSVHVVSKELAANADACDAFVKAAALAHFESML